MKIANLAMPTHRDFFFDRSSRSSAAHIVLHEALKSINTCCNLCML